MNVARVPSIYGVTIHQRYKNREINLSNKSWGLIQETGKDIDKCFDREEEKVWVLDNNPDGSQSKACVQNYNGKTYLHIRYYKKFNDIVQPLKHGISLNKEEWLNLKSLFSHNPEIDLATDALAAFLIQDMRKVIVKNCEGCARDWPSQTDHACLMEIRQIVDFHWLAQLTKACESSNYEFIIHMAQAAHEQKYSLQAPDAALRLAKISRQHMIKEIVFSELLNE